MNTTLSQNKTASLIWFGAWVLASAIGIVVGFLATLPLLWNATEAITGIVPQIVGQTLGGAFFGAGLGLAVGFAQWLVLRQRGEASISPAARWLGATVLGGLIGGIVAILFSVTLNDGGTNLALTAVSFGLLGGIIGAVQYAMARPVVKNMLWIAAGALGLAIGGAIPFGQYNLELVGVGVGGLIYGAFTAAALWWNSR